MLRIKNDRHVLFLQPHQLIVFSSGCASRRWPIVNNEIPDELSIYLLANSRAVFDLLIDLAEEESHLEALPPLGRRDIKHYIERIREKYFPHSMLSTVTHSRTKKDSAVLVSGISHSVLCEKLLEKLAGTESILKAIHSPVTLAPQLCKVLGLNGGAQLMVLRLDKSAFRLVACVDSFVVLNRRIEYVQSAEKDISDELVTSIGETLIYLSRKEIAGWISPKISLVDDYANDLRFSNGLKGALGADSRFEFQHVFPSLGISRNEIQPAGEESESLLTSVMNKGVCGYQKNSHRKFYLKNLVRQICLALSLSLFGGAISTAALARKVGEQYVVLSERYDQAENLAQSRTIVSELDYEPSVEAVRQAMVTAKFAEIRAQELPTVFLTQLSNVVRNYPALSIDTISWERQDLLDEESLRHVLGQSAGFDKLSMEMVYRATVSGVITGNTGSALDTFEAFVTTLRRTSTDSSVVVIEAPFGMSQSATTTAESLAGTDGSFVVEVDSAGSAQ